MYLLLIILSLKFYITAAQCRYHCKKLFYFCSVECSLWNYKTIFSSMCFLGFFSLFSAGYRTMTFSLVVTIMSSSIWACQSLRSVSRLQTGGILTTNFVNFTLLLVCTGFLVDFFLCIFDQKMDFHLNVVVVKFFPFYTVNLLCLWHFKWAEYNSGKIDCIRSNHTEKKAHIAWPSYVSYCRYRIYNSFPSSQPSPIR